MLYLVSDAKTFCKTQVNGGSCNSTEQLNAINEAIMHLLIAADWKLTQRRIRLYLCNDWFSCPREINRILGYTIDHNPGIVQSKYWEFMDGGPGRVDCSSYISARTLADMGNFPTFADIGLDKERYLIAFSTEEADTSLTINIKGHLTYNREVLTNGVPGIELPINRWSGGTEGTILNITTEDKSADTFVRVTGVTKPATKGYVTLYAYDPNYDSDEDEPMLQQLGVYHPDETQPAYRRYKVAGGNCCGGLLIALTKLAYVPAVRDDDVLLIQSLTAIKFMIQALNKYNNDDVNEGNNLKALALNELSLQARDYQPQGTHITVESSYANGEVPNLI